MEEPFHENLRSQSICTRLLQSLSVLLQAQPFESITVKALCTQAGIHRSTFYDYFEDKLHLLTYGIQELVDDLIIPPTDEPTALEHTMEQVFRYLSQPMFTKLLLDPQNANARQLLSQEFTRVLQKTMRGHVPKDDVDGVNTRCLFFTGGLLAIVTAWLGQDPRPSSLEIAQDFLRTVAPFFSLLPPPPSST